MIEGHDRRIAQHRGPHGGLRPGGGDPRPRPDRRAGEVVALLGANGAGKTTTLRVISGLVRSMSGRVTFAGHDLARVSPTKRARLGIARPRGPRALLRPDGHRALPARLPRRAAGRGRGVRVLPQAPELRTRRVGLLSGGEQQMLAVARGLARRPRLLLLDDLLGLAR